MKYAGLRPVEFTRRWPAAGWKLDYPVGHVAAARAAAAAARYFYLNRGWRRTRNLFSHLRVGWAGGAWVIQVFYVDRRRRRPVRTVRRGSPWRRRRRPGRRRLRRRTRWVRRAGRRPYLAGVAAAWGRGRWVWCRLPGLFEGRLETLMAHLVYRLRGRAERRTKSVALPILKLTRRIPGVLGASVRCHGRFSRRQRSERATYRWGTLHRTHLAARVADVAATATLRFGAVGVTLLVNYGGG